MIKTIIVGVCAEISIAFLITIYTTINNTIHAYVYHVTKPFSGFSFDFRYYFTDKQTQCTRVHVPLLSTVTFPLDLRRVAVCMRIVVTAKRYRCK